MFRPVLCVFLRDFFVAAVLSLLLPDAHCRDGAVQKTTPANPTASRPASGPFYPDIFIGRCLRVTAIDSGPPFLKDYQREAGWEIRAGIAYSPRISTEKELFYQHDGSRRREFWLLMKRRLPTHHSRPGFSFEI